MKDFRVEWSIDIQNTKTPLKAAEEAWRIMRAAGSTATVFEVTDLSDGTRYRVDLIDPESPVVPL